MVQEFDNIYDFLKKYGQVYGKKIEDEIKKEDYSIDLYDPEWLGWLSENIQQIYHAIGVLPTAYDPYLVVLKILLEKFDIGCDILEVACGRYPALGYDIARKQIELGCGTITFMDPNLICNEKNKLYKNVTPLCEPFTINTDISKYDIILAYRPHDVSFDLIKSVIDYNKDFLIFPCRCHDEDFFNLLDIDKKKDKSNIVPSFEYAKLLCERNDILQPTLEQTKVKQVYGSIKRYDYFYRKIK